MRKIDRGGGHVPDAANRGEAGVLAHMPIHLVWTGVPAGSSAVSRMVDFLSAEASQTAKSASAPSLGEGRPDGRLTECRIRHLAARTP